MVKDEEFHRAGAVDLQSQLDSIRRRVDIVESPLPSFVPARVHGLAELPVLHPAIDDLAVRNLDGDNPRMTRRNDVQAQRAQVPGNGTFENVSLRRRQGNDGSLMLQEFEGQPIGKETR